MSHDIKKYFKKADEAIDSRNVHQMRAVRDEMIAACESIANSAKRENRELSDSEVDFVDQVLGDDSDGGLNAKMTDAIYAQQKREQAMSKTVAARVSANGGRTSLGYQLEGASGEGVSKSVKNEVRSHNGTRARRFAKGEKMVHAGHTSLGAELQAVPNAFGEFALATMLGIGQHTPEPIRGAMSTNNNASVGQLVHDALASMLIDLARNRSVMLDAGATIYQMEAGEVRFAKVATDPTVEVKAENAKFAGSDPTFVSVTAVPYTMGVYCVMSRETAEDSINAAAIVEGLMAAKLGQTLDYYAIQGSGSEEPDGLINKLGIPSDAVSGSLDWFDLADSATTIRVANHEPTGFIMSPLNHGTLMKSTTGDAVNAAQNWLLPPPNMEGKSLFPTNNCPDDTIVCGDFSKLFWCVRTAPRLETSVVADETFARHQLALKLVVRADWIVSDNSAFHLVTGIS